MNFAFILTIFPMIEPLSNVSIVILVYQSLVYRSIIEAIEFFFILVTIVIKIIVIFNILIVFQLVFDS